MDSMQKAVLENLLNTASSWAHGRPTQPISIHIQEESQEMQTTTTVSSENHNGKTIESIAEKISQCTRCDLHRGRTNTVPGVGVKNPIALVIGEGPGQEEDAQGIPFVGATGQLLDKMLASIQLSRNTNCFISTIVKCRPPHSRDPLQSETEACASFLQAQITLLKPTIILAVGRIAAQALLQTSDGIDRLHGNFYEYPSSNQTGVASIPIMATYHPITLLRDPSYKKPAWEDLKLFKAKLEELSPVYAQSVNIHQNG